MVDNPQDLEKYNTAITNNYIIYRGFTVTQLNSNIDKPFIGASAIMKSQEDLKKQAAQIKDEYYEVKTKKEALEKEVELINSINIKPILDDLDKALALEKNKASLEDLKKKAKATRNMTPTELEDDYRKIDETINNNNDKKNQILLEIGSINQRIEALNQNIKENTVELETLTNELNKMAENNTVIAERANNEFNEMTSLQGFKNAINQYQERYKTEENSYNSLADAITAKQYAYINNYNSNLSIGINEVEKFLIELNKLEKSELITYEKKVREAREAAEVVFKEDFIAKLRNNILTAEQEIQKINETLSTIKFGQDSYEFIFPKNQEFSAFYDMVTSDLADYNQGLFTFEFQEKYDKEIKELFDSLSVTPLNSNGALNRFTDYRTYMGYDIRITNANGETMTYSKVFKEKSGGETQVPFYVAIVASFVRLYTKNTNIGGDPIGLIMFDEVFDKMDGNRMKAMMSFITSMPLQVIIACPPQRMDILRSYVDTTLIMVRQGNLAHVLPVNRKA